MLDAPQGVPARYLVCTPIARQRNKGPFMSSLASADLPTQEGHPKGLYVLFGAEMWERFSYYGMRALLVLYLTKHLNFSRADALDVYATYTGLVYLTPLLGGYLADRYLGQRKAILVGGLIMALGHFAMAFEPLLNYALGLIILGNGFFKPNISTMVGQLYEQNDPRKDGAYTIFYMGINLGAFFAPLVCGTLGERYGWHFGFGAAGVGMLFGLAMFLRFGGHLGRHGYPPGRSEGEFRLKPRDWIDVAVVALIGIGFVVGLVAIWPQLRGLWSPAKVAALIPQASDLALLGYRTLLTLGLASFVWLGFGHIGGGRVADASEETRVPLSFDEWQRIIVILIVSGFSVVFWMGFEQAGGTLTLFADKRTDLNVMGQKLPASWFQSVNPLLIFTLAPILSVLWTKVRLTATTKQGIGLMILGLGFVVMVFADRAAGTDEMVSPLWLVGFYSLATVAELLLSPIGLSLVNNLAPLKVASFMMAIWFLCTAIANYLAGKLESLLHGSNVELFPLLVATSLIPGIVLLVITPLLKKMSHGRL